MNCKKKAYKDKRFAIRAIHTISNKKDGRKKPVRAYKCDLCGKWHLTSKAIDEDATPVPYVLQLDWSKVYGKNTADA